MLTDKEKSVLVEWIANLRDIGVFGSVVDGDVFLIGYTSGYCRWGEEDFLDLCEDMDVLVTMYPELTKLDEDIIKILEQGLSSWYCRYRKRWMY